LIQGIPIGFFAVTIPTILISNGLTYTDLAILSFSTYPFSLKILTAPFQDAYFFKNFGKRKSYIVPIQYALGLLFIYTSYHIDFYIEQKSVVTFAVMGFIFIFLTANQDIAVDGLVLTALSPKRVNLGGTANNIGQMIGILISSSLFFQLSSAEFCAKYL
jgi:PAT family acetyl-CoA transporter-like MFS transporter 1